MTGAGRARRTLAAALTLFLAALPHVSGMAAGTVVYSGSGACRDIAFTYDVEFASMTQTLANTLEALNIRTTWFLLGDSVAAFPALTRQVAARHEIGNHSHNHPFMTRLTHAQMHQQLRDADESIGAVSGLDPRPIFRPPYGNYNSEVVQVADEEGYPYTVMWSVDTRDWENPSVGTIHSRIVNGAFPGAIVLMHGFPVHTAEATRLAVGDLRARGYQFVSVSEILGLERAQRDFGGDTYVVQAGDTADWIAGCHNLTGARLLAYNEAVSVAPGDRLAIPHRLEIMIWLNGERLPFTAYPRLVSGKAMVHVRMAEAMGAAAAWDGSKVIITRGGRRIEITPGQETALVDGVPVDMGAPAFFESSRVLAPVRFLAEALGGRVAWEQESYTVWISWETGANVAEAPVVAADAT